MCHVSTDRRAAVCATVLHRLHIVAQQSVPRSCIAYRSSCSSLCHGPASLTDRRAAVSATVLHRLQIVAQQSLPRSCIAYRSSRSSLCDGPGPEHLLHSSSPPCRVHPASDTAPSTKAVSRSSSAPGLAANTSA